MDQEKEFSVFGLIDKKLRAGLVVGLLTLSIGTNAILVIKIISMQADLYEKMLSRVDVKVNEKLEEPVRRMNEVATKVDTAADQASAAALRVDSISNSINDK